MGPSPPMADDFVLVDLPSWLEFTNGVGFCVTARAHVPRHPLILAPTTPLRLILHFSKRGIPSPGLPAEHADFTFYKPFPLLVHKRIWEWKAREMMANLSPPDSVVRADLDFLAPAFCEYVSSIARRRVPMNAVYVEISSFVVVLDFVYSTINAFMRILHDDDDDDDGDYEDSDDDDGDGDGDDGGDDNTHADRAESLKMIASDESNSCSICLEDFWTSSAPVLSMPCKHLFHATCLKKWLERSSSCPVCRFSLPEQYINNSGDNPQM